MDEYKSLEALELKPNQFLAASENYFVFNECEEIDLYVKKEDKIVYCIGDFYGDPEGAVISKNEKFCVSFGEGIVVYRLDPPFEELASDAQLIEYGRENAPNDIKWVEACSFVDDDIFEITLEGGLVERLKITEDSLIKLETLNAAKENVCLEIRKMINRSVPLNDNWEYGIADCKGKFVELLTKNIDESMQSLECEFSPYEIQCISEALVDVIKNAQSKEFVACLHRIYDKMPPLIQKLIAADVERAETEIYSVLT